MFKLLNNLFDYNSKEIKRLDRVVSQVNALEPTLQAASDAELRGKTEEFRRRLADGATLDDLMVEAFALVREAAVRAIGKRPFDVQILGAIVLHQGRIAEMKTGEGKTIVATLPAYLNALTGKGVHIVTVNDYLARYHSEIMGPIFRFLGLSVGVILHDMSYEQRKAAYACDITYGTNNEFGFDYLRDNMAIAPEQMVQRDLHYAIIDEVDSILIDEARTPLIISGQGEQTTELYNRFAALIPRLRSEEDYNVDEKANSVTPTAAGIAKAEQFFGVDNLYDDTNLDLSHHFNQALRAHVLMKKDRDYVVKDGQIVIVDEFTGRMMYGRRYSAGLHQAIEAKEGVKIERESQTLASITFQNYFRMYGKLAGMTGTAATEEDEFRHIYRLDVVVIPTNKPMIRDDMQDVVYKTEKAKFNAVVESIVERHASGQPILVGTVSIEKSEHLSSLLKRRGVKHQVLNAKYHEKEAEIIAQAGRLNSVTISTNMAGRGTDILLGGNPEFMARTELLRLGVTPEELVAAFDYGTDDERSREVMTIYKEQLAKIEEQCRAEHEKVVAAGGLHVIGTERHESRRIDNQLRGRSGRQGDPGSSQFYISLEDDLMRLFGADMVSSLMDRLGLEEDTPIDHPLLSKSIERAQKRVESRNFDIRKHVLQYDDIMNQQREVIYKQRREVLTGKSLRETINAMINDVIDKGVELYTPDKVYPEDWDIAGLWQYAQEYFPLPEGLDDAEWREFTQAGVKDALWQIAQEAYAKRISELGDELMADLERVIILRTVDSKWMSHLDAMDELRSGIGLRAYAQKDPLVEYRLESYDMFQQMIEDIKYDVVRFLYQVQVVQRPQARPLARPTRNIAPQPAGQPPKSDRVGRNDACPCGSGRKYKRCCGKDAD